MGTSGADKQAPRGVVRGPAERGARSAYKRFGAAKTLPQAGLIPAEDDGNTGVPMEARFHGAELEGLE